MKIRLLKQFDASGHNWCWKSEPIEHITFTCHTCKLSVAVFSALHTVMIRALSTYVVLAMLFGLSIQTEGFLGFSVLFDTIFCVCDVCLCDFISYSST